MVKNYVLKKVPRRERWYSDKEIANCFGKSYKEMQRLLRLMATHPEAGKWISKSGGRSTNFAAFEQWLQWYETNKNKRNKSDLVLRIS